MGFSKKSFIKHEQNAVVLSTIEHAPGGSAAGATAALLASAPIASSETASAIQARTIVGLSLFERSLGTSAPFYLSTAG